MADYRNSKWASEIIELQKDDGSWGYFHTLSNPSKRNPITTEQAIRRLEILGYTINDKPIILFSHSTTNISLSLHPGFLYSANNSIAAMYLLASFDLNKCGNIDNCLGHLTHNPN